VSDLFDETPADEFSLPGDDALIRKISAAEPVEAEYQEPDGEAVPVERVRDESGRFAKAESATDEPVADAEPDPVEPDAVVEGETAAEASERLLAGNFKNVDDLERAYEDLRSRFGQQGNELGEIRRAFDERLNKIDDRLANPPAAPQQITQELVDTNPGYATALAYEQGNQGALAVAYESWKVEDPAAAGAWLGAKQAEQLFNQQLAAQQQQIQELRTQIEPAAAVATEQQRAALVAAAAAKHPGLAEFVGSDAINDLATEIPEFGQMLASGQPELQARAITNLYEVHRGRESANLKVGQQEVARAVARAGAAGAGRRLRGVNHHVDQRHEAVRADEIAAEWDAMRSPFDDGWNIP
jgi:hypothetical protein